MDLKVLIPYAIDNPKRARNLNYVCKYFKDNGINPIVLEHPRHDNFPKSKICNDAYKEIGGGIIYMCDVDCIVDMKVLREGYRLLKNNPRTIVYPFTRVLNIDPKQYHSSIDGYHREDVIIEFKNMNPDCNLDFFRSLVLPNRHYKTDLSNINMHDLGMNHHMGYGFMFDYNAYKKIGLDNEYFLDFNFEDLERFVRAKTLGYDTKWLIGTLFHMDHKVYTDNGQSGLEYLKENQRQYITQNIFEFLKVVNMNKEELKAYIKTWPWTK